MMGKLRKSGRTMVRALLTTLLPSLRPLARRLLPSAAKRRLAGLLHAVEVQQAELTAARFKARTVSLNEFPPLWARGHFAGGPVVLVNNALAWGGVERQVVNTLRGLERLLDRDLGLLCLRLGYGPDYDFNRPALSDFRGFVRNVVSEGETATVLSLHLTPIDLARVQAVIGWMPPDVQTEIMRFIAEFTVLKPEVVHIWQDGASISAGFAAKIVGVPRVIVSSRNMNPTNFAYYRPFMEYGYREIAECDDITMINNSEAGADDYATWLHLDPSRFTVVRNGVDPGDFSRPSGDDVNALRRRIGLSAAGPVVGSVFRFYDEKRPLLWIDAASRVARERQDCRFVVFGTGPLADEMRSSAERLGFADRLYLPGTVAETATAMSLFDVFLLTSRFEGTPNVVLEASLLGIPVVATSAGGTREAIADDRTGYVAERPDPELLAEYVLQILASPARWSDVREDGPAFVQQRFGLERMLQETLDLYRLH